MSGKSNSRNETGAVRKTHRGSPTSASVKKDKATEAGTDSTEKLLKFIADDESKQLSETQDDGSTIYINKISKDSVWKPVSDRFMPTKIAFENSKGQVTQEQMAVIDKKSGFCMPLSVVGFDETMPATRNWPFLDVLEADAEAFCHENDVEASGMPKDKSYTVQEFVSSSPLTDGAHCLFNLKKGSMLSEVRQMFTDVTRTILKDLGMIWMNRYYAPSARAQNPSTRVDSKCELTKSNYWQWPEDYTDNKFKALLEDGSYNASRAKLGDVMLIHASEYAQHYLLRSYIHHTLDNTVYCNNIFYIIPNLSSIKFLAENFLYLDRDPCTLDDNLLSVLLHSIELGPQQKEIMQFFSKSVTVVKSRRIQGTSTYMMVLSWKNSKIKFDDANGAPNSVTCNMSVMFHLDLLDAFIQAVRRMGWLGFENYWNSCEKNFFLVEIGSVLKTGIKNHIVATDTSFEKLWGIACQNISEKSFKPYNAEELAVAEAKKDTSGGIIESKKEIYANCVADEVIEIEPAITTKSKESV